MRGRDFLSVARQMALGLTEAEWRTGAGRAYYALFLEAREALQRWNFQPPPRDQAHRFVRLHFDYPADAELKIIGYGLDNLSQFRNKADYQLLPGSWFANSKPLQDAVTVASNSLAVLDQIDANPARRSAAIAAIRAAFP